MTPRPLFATLLSGGTNDLSIRIYNRTCARAKQLINDLGQRMDVSRVEVVRSIDDLNIEILHIVKLLSFNKYLQELLTTY